VIVLLGATGYTGTLVAEAMVARGLAPTLAGRDPDRLAALAARLGGLSTAHAEVADRTSVFELVSRGDVLVSTVGPFRRLGWPAVRAAVDAGAVYLDSAGEPPFIRSVHDWFGPQAARSGAALLTAFGSDYVPGVLAGALALRDAGPAARRVDIGYFAMGRGRLFSRGTARSIAGLALEPGYGFRGGRLRAEPTAARMRTFVVDGRPLPAVTIGGSEQYALPRLAPGLDTVDVHAGWFGRASGALHASARVAPLLQRVPGVRTVGQAIGDGVARRLPDAPSVDAVAAARSHVVAEAFDGAGVLLARVHLAGPEPYALTAGLLAWGAGQASARGVSGTGALDAVTAFGLDTLVAGTEEAGLIRS
jgi:Saccharopine dehydrogenase NADP binding domain